MEAAGQGEADSGLPAVGKAGYFLWNTLKQVGLHREDFRLHNVLSCQPPANKLAGMWYEHKVITSCSPNLDTTIEDARRRAAANGKNFVIFALGRIAVKRILGLSDSDQLMKKDYGNYPIWSEKYQAHVICGDHPSYLMRGMTELLPVLQYAALRATEIATDLKFVVEEPDYLLDPESSTFTSWVNDYLDYQKRNPEVMLSYDLETPFKSKEDDEEKVSKEDDPDRTIIRISFCYIPGYSVSIPWNAEYMNDIRRLFAGAHTLVGWNSDTYDSPRVKALMPINGVEWDGMVMWHLLNSSLPKGLGFVTPFYWKNTSPWKHTSQLTPAYYNAKDADAALRNILGIKFDLEKHGLWKVYQRHVLDLNVALKYMTGIGVLRDSELRQKAEDELSIKLKGIDLSIQNVIPDPVRGVKVYKKVPKSLEGLVQVDRDVEVNECCRCKLESPKKSHFKSKSKFTCSACGKKWSITHPQKCKLGGPATLVPHAVKEELNPCVGETVCTRIESRPLWAKLEPFRLSKQSLTRYAEFSKHKLQVEWKTEKVTFDESAIERLMTRYSKDPLYPLILEQRRTTKLLSTYIGVTAIDGSVRGGLPVGPDGRIRTSYSHNPSTLRLASQGPNLQNIPRVNANDPDDPANIIRKLVVPAPGSIFLARDFSGIEAVLTGYFAGAPGYIRLAKQDVHSFYTAYALHQLDGRIPANDLPLLSWDDEKLFKRLAEIKKEFKSERNNLYKHLIHAANFGQGAKGASEKIFAETGHEHSPTLIAKLMGVYFELFPEIKRWQWAILYQAEQDKQLRNPFGYVHRFSRPFEYEKVGTKWERKWGPDANRVMAFLPQSTAAGIIKDAILRLFENRFEEAGQYMRLQIHDEIFCEVPTELKDYVDQVLQVEMERPIQCMPLVKEYGMGDFLVVLTEPKSGFSWGTMR